MLLLRILAVTLLLAGSARAEPPSDTVTAFHAALTEMMRAEEFTERLGRITPAIAAHFRVATIARISLGRNWQTLTDTDRARYQDLMAELIATTYAARFDGFDGQLFTTLESRPLARDRVVVRSRLSTRTETVSLDYQLQQVDDAWKIYDVIANGVSDLSLKRSNYAAMFKAGGLAAVMSDIEAEIAENRNSHPE